MLGIIRFYQDFVWSGKINRLLSFPIGCRFAVRSAYRWMQVYGVKKALKVFLSKFPSWAGILVSKLA